jgi:hypothetical protein
MSIREIKVPTFTRFILRERHSSPSDCSGMEPSLEEYKKFAGECRRLAQLAKTAEEKKILQEMEAAWVEVVERADGKGS